MATKESIRVMESRKGCDQVSFLMRKGGRDLLRVLALKDGVTVADLLRYAVLNLSGLAKMPSTEDMQALASITDGDEAAAALDSLKEKYGHADAEHKMRVDLRPGEWDQFWDIADQIDDAIEAQNKKIAVQGMNAPGLDHIRVWLTEDQIVTIQRAIARHDTRRQPETDENGVKIFR